jgi:acetyl esterase/lipase
MSASSRPLPAPSIPVGPPPPVDRECAAVLAQLPEFPPLDWGLIPLLREAEFIPRPSNEDLSRDGAFDVEERTVPGPPGAPDIGLIICRPAAVESRIPALFYIHGGGMVSGTARDALNEILDLVVDVDAAVVSVEYRLAPETRHPGQVEDCYAGRSWTAEHAEDLGFEAERIVLVGGSAGGGIAAAVALLARDRRGPAIAGQLLMCPMLDDRNDTPSAHQMAVQPMWNRAANELGWSALLGDSRGGPDVSPYAAPARATDLSLLPPTFIDVGSVDTFRDEDVAYASAIWLAGGVAELHVWPGAFHGFDGIAPHAAISRTAVAARRNWLGRVLTS